MRFMKTDFKKGEWVEFYSHEYEQNAIGRVVDTHRTRGITIKFRCGGFINTIYFLNPKECSRPSKEKILIYKLRE